MPELTAEMIREAEAHLPFDVTDRREKWEWISAFLNRALLHPGVPCPCCGVAPNGEIFDHMTPAEWLALQPNT